MNKERMLTIRWKNILTIGLGIPTLAYIISAWKRVVGILWRGRNYDDCVIWFTRQHLVS